MVENVIVFLIYVIVIVGLVYLALYVVGRLGLSVPPMLVNILWLLVLLVILLLAWRAFSPFIGGGGRLFPR